MVAVGIGKDILREKPLKLGDLSVKETDELKMVSVSCLGGVGTRQRGPSASFRGLALGGAQRWLGHLALGRGYGAGLSFRSARASTGFTEGRCTRSNRKCNAVIVF